MSQTTRLKGWEAIERASVTGELLSKYADPIEGARNDLDLDEAREVAAQDAGLIYLDVAADKAGA